MLEGKTVSGKEHEGEADDPDDEVRQVLARGLGSLVEVDGHHPGPALEAAGVVAGVLQAFFVEHRKGDVERQGDEPIRAVFHGGLDGMDVALMDHARDHPLDQVADQWGKGQGPDDGVANASTSQRCNAGVAKLRVQFGVSGWCPGAKALPPDRSLSGNGGCLDELAHFCFRNGAFSLAIALIKPCGCGRCWCCAHLFLPAVV